MKKYWAIGLFLLGILMLVVGCSASNSNDKSEMDSASSEMSVGDGVVVEEDRESLGLKNEETSGEVVEENIDSSDRMVIHRAYLHLRVSDFQQSMTKIEQKVEQYNGYIIESVVYKDEDETANGNITVRIPEKDFQSFLTDTENAANSVIERNVTGEDVTEQYVDLEARLNSKRILEERLHTFMKEAEKTEDLLKISSDLAIVQEEIERLVGKMKYLENQTAFSTVDISLFEDRIIMPHVDGKGQNTWDKTKKQFFTSINFLLKLASGLIVFIVGNLPILILLSIIGFGIYFGIRKINNRKTL